MPHQQKDELELVEIIAIATTKAYTQGKFVECSKKQIRVFDATTEAREWAKSALQAHIRDCEVRARIKGRIEAFEQIKEFGSRNGYDADMVEAYIRGAIPILTAQLTDRETEQV